MTEAERRDIGRTRRLVFQNLANGLAPEQVMAALRLSELEVDKARRTVSRKITEYLVLRRQPPIACDGLTAIRFNRQRLLAVLARIGDLDLSSDLILARITVQALDHPEMIEGAKHRMDEVYHR
jgi:hypothetical protein